MFAMIKDFDTTTDVHPSLESQMARLALESGVINNVIETFRNTIPALTLDLVEKFKAFKADTETDTNTQVIRAEFGKLKVKLVHADFVRLNDTLVSVPEGFKGNLLEYVESLGGMAAEIFQQANKTLGEYNFALSAFITNKESKVSLKDYSDLFIRVKTVREKMTEQIAAHFDPNSNLPKQKLGSVIDRIGDLEKLTQACEKLHGQFKGQNLREVSESVRKSVDLLNIIVNSAKEDGFTEISGNAALNISTGAYEVAKYVEFIAIYRFRVEQLFSTVEKLLSDLQETV